MTALDLIAAIIGLAYAGANIGLLVSISSRLGGLHEGAKHHHDTLKEHAGRLTRLEAIMRGPV